MSGAGSPRQGRGTVRRAAGPAPENPAEAPGGEGARGSPPTSPWRTPSWGNAREQAPGDVKAVTQMDVVLGPRQRPCPDVPVIDGDVAKDRSRTARLTGGLPARR
ncbi:hypothetical protein GCM10017673_47950 [Streptosporangium violaceochromogenes]|nr:hypothetical protein GCM10017673_47950 [Streptosporangium violaceochromogenes]